MRPPYDLTISDLSLDGELALRGLRHAAQGPLGTVLYSYQQTFGIDAPTVTILMLDLAKALEASARRRPNLHNVMCPHISDTELSMLKLLEAASGQQHAHMMAHLLWLTHPNTHVDLLYCAKQIAGLFETYGLSLDLGERCHQLQAPRPDWPRALTLCKEPSRQAAHG